jgi:hypothetical protein
VRALSLSLCILYMEMYARSNVLPLLLSAMYFHTCAHIPCVQEACTQDTRRTRTHTHTHSMVHLGLVRHLHHFLFGARMSADWQRLTNRDVEEEADEHKFASEHLDAAAEASHDEARDSKMEKMAQ